MLNFFWTKTYTGSISPGQREVGGGGGGGEEGGHMIAVEKRLFQTEKMCMA